MLYKNLKERYFNIHKYSNNDNIWIIGKKSLKHQTITFT